MGRLPVAVAMSPRAARWPFLPGFAWIDVRTGFPPALIRDYQHGGVFAVRRSALLTGSATAGTFSLALTRPASGSSGSARDRLVHAARPVAAVKAMVCVHHAGSAHQARNVSIDRSSSLPEATRRARSSLTVSRQYTAQAEPPL